MGAIASAFASAFRDFQTDGDPTSGIFNPLKSAIRTLGATIEANISGQPVNGGLISGTGVNLTAGLRYGANTGVNPVSANLPQLSTVSPGATILIRDVDFNAFNKNVTINAFYGDQIMFETTALTNIAIKVNGAQIELVANGSYWRASFYVG